MGFVSDMQYLFALQNYDRSVEFSKKSKESLAASVAIEEDYQRIKITIFPCFWENSLKNQAEYLLHEFCHYLVLPIDTIAYNTMIGKVETAEHRRVALEKSTSSIANILDSILCGKHSLEMKIYQKYFAVPKKLKKKRHAAKK